MQRRRGLQSVPFSAFARNSSVFQLGQGKFRIGNQGARIWSTVAKREIQVADPRGRADVRAKPIAASSCGVATTAGALGADGRRGSGRLGEGTAVKPEDALCLGRLAPQGTAVPKPDSSRNHRVRSLEVLV